MDEKSIIEISKNFFEVIREQKQTISKLETENAILKTLLSSITEVMINYAIFCNKKNNQFEPDVNYGFLEDILCKFNKLGIDTAEIQKEFDCYVKRKYEAEVNQ